MLSFEYSTMITFKKMSGIDNNLHFLKQKENALMIGSEYESENVSKR